MDQDQITRAPWGITTLVSCLPVLVLGMGTALAHMLREDAAAADPAQTNAPGPATRVLPVRSPADQSEDQPDQNPPDRTATKDRPPGRTVTLPLYDGHGVAEYPAPGPRAAGPDIDYARGIARELAAAGQHVSRRLCSRGVKGSNEALNALALRLSAELPIDTAMCSLGGKSRVLTQESLRNPDSGLLPDSSACPDRAAATLRLGLYRALPTAAPPEAARRGQPFELPLGPQSVAAGGLAGVLPGLDLEFPAVGP
jgi:hypothetical protein